MFKTCTKFAVGLLAGGSLAVITMSFTETGRAILVTGVSELINAIVPDRSKNAIVKL